ncbi:uncharacterized protein si:ch211-188c16.1 [Corythoichthys intestinalis]|uniref:uncharacterized protein si:ch211-188c16.1 n=1 Tax=Corythoichthys intestinalis TaxID=161448 RepID=UPI0025A4E56E|nr:uncharacterized protein si:ch211-188c16.1 [Corythoichthys intestinalis]
MKPKTMEEESQINFKALRAKFQEDALLAKSQNTGPILAEKPKMLSGAGGHCVSGVSRINHSSNSKTAVVPRVFVRDELPGPGAKRPICFPPQPLASSPSSQPINEDGAKRQSLKERYTPPVPPVPPVFYSKQWKTDQFTKKDLQQEKETAREITPPIKFRKSNLVLSFKSSKVSKYSTESEEEPSYAELTTRPRRTPGELGKRVQEKQNSKDCVSLQITRECGLFSPEVSVTPSSTEMNVDSGNCLASTLERAKKFSQHHILIYNKPKALHLSDLASSERTFLSPPKTDFTARPTPVVGLPHLACISARPFSKVSNSAREPALTKKYHQDKAEPPYTTAELTSHPNSQKNLLPDLKSLGPKPLKPPRPPLVALRRYYQLAFNEVLKDTIQEPTTVPIQVPTKVPESEKPICSAILNAPMFPDFKNTEMEPMDSEAVDFATLDLEPLHLGGFSTPPPAPTDCISKASQSDLCLSTGLNEIRAVPQLKRGRILPPLNSLPEPSSNLTESIRQDQRSKGEDVMVPSPQTSQTNKAGQSVESQSARDETELGLQAILSKDDIHTHTSEQNYECDNVYEDVESISKFFFCQNSHKQKGHLKNPYADNSLPAKEETSHTWPRKPWGSISGEHSSDNHTNRKECQSPNTAESKEMKKKEKQRLEKEKKEQKEREKKVHDMKKKFKVTGDEEPMYHAKVVLANKVRKNDLPVQSGDTVSIIRTTNCPRGKWLARNACHKYGYISVMNIELNIKEMLELGKKAQATGRGSNLEEDTISVGSKSSSHLVVTSSFTDDSEEWACEDETLLPCYDSNTRHEALQKLTTFFELGKDESGDIPDVGVPTLTKYNILTTT